MGGIYASFESAVLVVGWILPDPGRASASTPADMRAWGARATVDVAPTGSFGTGAALVLWLGCLSERECCVASLEQGRAG